MIRTIIVDLLSKSLWHLPEVIPKVLYDAYETYWLLKILEDPRPRHIFIYYQKKWSFCNAGIDIEESYIKYVLSKSLFQLTSNYQYYFFNFFPSPNLGTST
jgi:hypothetical protein